MKRLSCLSLGLLLVACVSSVFGQGLLIVEKCEAPVPLPRPIIYPLPKPVVRSYKVKELTVQTRVTDQVARSQVSQTFVNTGSVQMEVSFLFPLPYEGAIDRLTFLVDGKEYDAKLLPAKDARNIYESYVRRNQDPALLEWMGTGMFKTSVFPVPPGAERKVTLRYSQLLRKDHQITDFLFPMRAAKYTSAPIEKIAFEASIQSSAEIKSVYSPTHEIEVKRSGKHQASVKFEAKNQIPTSDFRLFYDTAEGSIGASVISYRPDKSEDGYLLLLASPEIKTATDKLPPKTAVFVVDRSGSMSGKKMEQAKEALKFVINNLRENDLFNIVAYDSSVESFKPELQRFTDESRKAALGWIDGVYAGGSTNIDGALSKALEMIQDDSRPNFIVFLTDGKPTAGETNEAKIVENSGKNNKLKTRIVSFGVGYDVNSRLLDRLSRENRGQSEYVRPNEDIEAYVSRLYKKISSPVLSDVAVKFEFDAVKTEDGSPVNRIYPRTVSDLFEGQQLVIVGRYKKHGAAKVVVTGRVGKDEQKFDFPATLAAGSSDESYAFVEKLWAMRRIGEIIDQLDLVGQNEEMINELVALSTKHGILTPYTSFLAEDDAAATGLADVRRQLDRAKNALGQLREAEGRRGFIQRDEKKAFQEANQVAGGFAPAPSAPAADDPTAAPRPGGGGFGGAKFRDLDTDKVVVADSVLAVGKETLYRRGDTWIAANAKDVDLKRDADQIKTIKRFSDDYFKLTAGNTASANAVLSRQRAGEELIIKLRGQIYRIQ